jgi:hypothetical protein
VALRSGSNGGSTVVLKWQAGSSSAVGQSALAPYQHHARVFKWPYQPSHTAKSSARGETATVLNAL